MTMRIKARAKDDLVEVKLIAKHPMDSGQVQDKDGNVIPAHYIERLTATRGEEVVFTAQLGPAVSKDPYLKFFYRGAAGDALRLHWIDSQGAEETAEVTVK